MIVSLRTMKKCKEILSNKGGRRLTSRPPARRMIHRDCSQLERLSEDPISKLNRSTPQDDKSQAGREKDTEDARNKEPAKQCLGTPSTTVRERENTSQP